MGCPSAEHLRAFLDDQTDDSASAQIAGHVDRCAMCQAALDNLSSSQFDPFGAKRDSRDIPDDDRGAVEALIDLMQNRPEDTFVSPELARNQESLADSAVLLPSTLGNYDLLKVIGEGATGRLYRAHDRQLDRIVAVKILKSELAAIASARARFEREARACASLNHDHIISVHQVDPGDATQPPYLVMEYVAGGSLHDRLEAGATPDLRETVAWIRQTALALEAAHQAGIVHRDIKPSNLMIDEVTSRIRVADFGLARLIEADESLTAEGMIAGTPAYMSPEQIINPGKVNGLTDIYSLGVVLYEAITGELPFRGMVRMVLNQVLHEDPVPPRRLNDRIPRDLENVCLKAMARERHLRYQTAAEFADDLQRWLDGEAVHARPVSMIWKAGRWCRRNPRAAGVAVIVLGVLVAGAVDWKQYDSSREQRRREADQYRQAAEAQAINASEQRDLALRTVQALVFEVQAELESQPGMELLREKLLEIAVEGLQQISDGTTQSGTADFATVVALNRLGEIYLEVGREDDATTVFERAASNARECIMRDDQPTASRQALSWSLMNLARLDQSRGETPAAAEKYGEALKLCQQVLKSVSQQNGDEELHWRATRDYCVVLQRLGAIDELNGQSGRAAERYLMARDALQEQADTHPDETRLSRDLGILHVKLAGIAVGSGQAKSAELFREARSHFRNALERTPDDASLLRDLAWVSGDLAANLNDEGELEEAESVTLEELQLLAKLRERNADDQELVRRYGTASLRLGTLKVRREDWDSAESPLRDANSCFTALTSGSSASIRDRILLAETEFLLASRLVTIQEFDDAVVQLQRTDDRLQALQNLISDSDQGLLAAVRKLRNQCQEVLQSASE